KQNCLCRITHDRIFSVSELHPKKSPNSSARIFYVGFVFDSFTWAGSCTECSFKRTAEMPCAGAGGSRTRRPATQESNHQIKPGRQRERNHLQSPKRLRGAIQD